MLFNVPQFIDTEDKIVGPLTAKQLGWMGLAGVCLLLCWSLLDTPAFIISAIIIGVIFGALAFYRPYNQPLIKFIISSVSFAFRPKIYIWRRYYATIKNVERKTPASQKNNTETKKIKKKFDNTKINELSKILDKNK